MNRLLSSALAVALLLGGTALAAPAPSPNWPQAASDLPADPSARFGVLANGMRYAVMKNATPAGQTSIRLRIGSGSLEESDAQPGLAHVLEHMAFKGSTHVPPGEMIKILERKGLAFGPDTNAQTDWSQTVYMLDLPHSDADTLATGLMLMRETASELLIDPTALESERGVVLSEERLRDTPQYRADKAQIDLLAHGQLATRRFPIGQVDVIKTAPASLVRQFYEANYRPDRAALIVVGDFDPAMMEAQIKERFSDWKPVGAATAEPDLGQIEKRGLTVKVVDLPGASTQTQIAWARPYDASLDTAAKRRRDTVEHLALAVLNRRLNNLAQADHPPFLNADAGFQNLLHSNKVAVIEAVSAPDAWRPALGAIDTEVRRLTTYGVSQEELAREITQYRAGLQNAVAGAGTRPTPELATSLVESVDEDEVFTSPEADLTQFDADVKSLTLAEVDAAARAVFAGAGPLVEVASPIAVEGGEAAVAAAYAKSQATPVTAPVAQAAIKWPYESFGAPGKVVQRTDIADMGAVSVRFANGVSLIVKQTDFRKDQILVSVQVGGGRLDLPLDKANPAWASPAYLAGGFKGLSLEDSQRALAGRIYGAEFAIGNQAFDLHGATRPQDLATQLQVLTAYLADPGFRSEAFERVRTAYLAALPQLEATPDGVVNRDFEALLRNGDPRWAFPSKDQIQTAKPADLSNLLSAPLGSGPIEITIVGDVTADKAIAEVAATLGALPARPAKIDPAPGALKVRFPAPTAEPVRRTDTGRPDQAVAILAWPLTDFYADMPASRAVNMAGEVLQNRILDEVRIKQGATYSPQVEVSLSETFPGYGFAFAMVEMPPAKIPGFFADVARITADMRDKGVTDDELERARNPRVAGIKKAQLTNDYWISRLSGAVADPRRLDVIRTTLPDYAKLTTADIQAAARKWFVPDKAWKMVVGAAGATSPSPPS